MKYCTNCGAGLPDESIFCTACGAPAPVAAPIPAAVPDPRDHTGEFDPQDIAQNKLLCMLIYLAGIFGILIAHFMNRTSQYVAFHVRQGLKFTVLSLMVSLVLGVGLVINIIPIVGWIVYALLLLAGVASGGTILVLQIICFIQVCKGKAKEAPIIGKLGFLN